MTEHDATVFVIDDDEAIQKGLNRMLDAAGYRVEGFVSAESFLKRLPFEGRGCILLDINMPGLNGLELQQELRKHDYTMPVIFLTGHADVSVSVKAMKAGALDFKEKPFKADELLTLIKSAVEMDALEHQAYEERIDINLRLDALTPREHEVMTYVIAGFLNKQIAAELGISEKTVKVHRGRVMEKMRIHSVAELVRMSEKVGVEPGTVSE